MSRASGLSTAVASFGDRFPEARHACVAFSGGRDSHVLLETAVACLRDSPVVVSALHINHNLHDDSSRWAAHCESVCASLQVQCDVIAVSVQASGGGVEAAARAARYAAFAERIQPHTVLLQAHHADDQLETVLLRLARGCGVHGAAGIPDTRPVGAGLIWRPFLAFTGDQIAERATSLGLDWVEDPSNADTRFDRNFLRHAVVPALRERWPGIAQSFGTAAANFSDAAELLDGLSDGILANETALACSKLVDRPRPEARLILHRWLRRADVAVPSRATLDRIIDQVALARQGAQPVVQLGTRAVRRHRQALYLVTEQEPFDTDIEIAWEDPHTPIRLPSGHTLSAEHVLADGLSAEHLATPWLVRFRRGSAELKLVGKPRATVKKLLNACGVPPWERPALPHLYINGRLAWVAGLGVDVDFIAS